MASEDEVARADLFDSYANLRHMDPVIAEQMLKEAKEIMDQLGVQFFIRQGTCLGAIRNQSFIPWDDDIDLGCVIGLHGLTEDKIPLVFDAFRSHGYYVDVETNDHWVSAGMMKLSTRIDLTFFRVIDDHIFHFPMNWIPVRLFSNLKEIECLGGNYLVPNPPEEYLELKYGPNWVTPKEFFYEKDILAQSGKASVVEFASTQGQPSTTVRVLNQKNEIVKGAEVSVVGLAEESTNDYGRVEFSIPYDDFYAVVIKFGDHEEILYQEWLGQGESYVYRPDPSKITGRLRVLTEEG